MIKRLTVRNFAVVDALTLEPGPGLNALTGETGAGKSIVIEALGFALGARASGDWLRAGAQKLEVEAVFEQGERELVLRRELDAEGRTRAWIDGKASPVSALAALGDALVDFHGQHEHQTLLRPAAQLELLDAYGADDGPKNARIGVLRPQAEAAYRRYVELGRQLEALDLPEEERAKRLDLCRFQVEEIESASLKAGEEEALEAELPRLKNAEKLAQLATEAYGHLYEAEGSAQERLLKAERALVEMGRLDPAADEQAKSLAVARALVEEAARRAGEYRDKADMDPAELDRVLGRLDKIARLKKKHGAEPGKISEALERLKHELAWLEDASGRAAQVQQERERAEADLDRLCAALHKARMAAGARLSTAAAAELKGLGMPAARLSVSVELEEGAWGPSGADRVEFLIAANPGESLKPLKSVASGGELSRAMLALKTVLVKADRVPVLVFDEVDAGVGGAVARTVGERLAALGRGRQVLCVTHLAQVAGHAARHFHISKTVAGGRTRAQVETLEGEKRLQALAVMMGGRDASAASLRHARELLDACKEAVR